VGGFWHRLLDALAVPAPVYGGGSPAKASSVSKAASHGRIVVGPPSRTVVGPVARPVVEKVRRPAWDEKEWVRTEESQGTVYRGHFRAGQNGRTRAFEGRIVQGKRELAAYIGDPPPEIRRHPKGPCFSLISGSWFRVHWHKAPDDPDNAILYVETILNEALNG
jgi:hypothetical protein